MAARLSPSEREEIALGRAAGESLSRAGGLGAEPPGSWAWHVVGAAGLSPRGTAPPPAWAAPRATTPTSAAKERGVAAGARPWAAGRLAEVSRRGPGAGGCLGSGGDLVEAETGRTRVSPGRAGVGTGRRG